ncbi:hypothetical protein [Methylophaga sp.]|uniref:hypothetical protein n=1 Tax=Methylophaga sp. TaxID=2024840 RepID=UPI003F70838E
MYGNEDKQLRLINECRGIAFSSDSLKRYQTKITKLANSLKKDILEGPVRGLFNKEDIHSIEKAMSALSKFSKTVSHAKESKSREEKQKAEILKIDLEHAETVFKKKYPYDESNILNKLRFCIAVGFANDIDVDSMLLERLERRITHASPSWIESFPGWIDNVYLDCIRTSANLIMCHGVDVLTYPLATRFFKRIDEELLLIDMKAGNVLENVALYLDKSSQKLTNAYN